MMMIDYIYIHTIQDDEDEPAAVVSQRRLRKRQIARLIREHIERLVSKSRLG